MARKVTDAIVDAWLSGATKTYGNSHTDGTSLFLHGNEIARRSGEQIEICTAGWDTVTTRERLNGIPGVRVWHAKRELYLNGKPWDGSWTTI